ncbi:hypothetical protein [Streptomyces sp. NPDC001507]|uniref:hypothetical protein n=1 Tax=Streptomyces sp. NPDC001507 TaxID=3364579 RepID=UPI0036C55471
MNTNHQHRTMGKGAAVHVVLASGWTACGKQGVYGEPVATGATCGNCARRAPELTAPIAPAPVPAAKPKAKRKAKKGRKPRVTKAAGTTKLFASDKNADAASIPGARWAAVVRSTGALTASVNCAEYGLIDAADKWMALCVTHDEHYFHPTHRDAWEARRRPQDWCGGCAAVVADR